MEAWLVSLLELRHAAKNITELHKLTAEGRMWSIFSCIWSWKTCFCFLSSWTWQIRRLIMREHPGSLTCPESSDINVVHIRAGCGALERCDHFYWRDLTIDHEPTLLLAMCFSFTDYKSGSFEFYAHQWSSPVTCVAHCQYLQYQSDDTVSGASVKGGSRVKLNEPPVVRRLFSLKVHAR